MSKHTPGPWNYGVQQLGHYSILGPLTDNGNWRVVANTTAATEGVQTEEANARLIAAAPELYSACRAMIEVYSGDPDAPACRLMRDALAKAEGRATSE